jgi:hypothetical protein
MQLDQQEKEFESWDLSEPAVPRRCKCFHLQPMGFGTGYVECLTSYFSRLAVAHSVSAGALTHRIMIPRNAGKRNMFSCAVSCRVTRLRCPTSGINSIGSMAVRFSSVVGELTGRSDIHYLTMLPWKELLPPQLLTRGMDAWCPHCINECRETGRSVYIPLLWTLEIVKYCPLHQSPLQLMCPHCKAPQPFIAQRSPNGYCARCKKWLGKAVRESGLDQFSVLRPESSDWEIWVAREVAETIERSFASPARLKRDTLSKIIRAGVAAEGFSGFARLLGVSTAAIQSWRLGQSSPMLPVYLRLARVFHLSLPDLLTNRVRSRLVVDTSDVPYWRAIRIATPAVFDPGRAKHHLEKALRESPPPSFGVFRTRHRYHDSTLKNHFPKLCALLVKRNHDYRTAASAKRLTDRLSEFRNVVYRFHEQGRELVLNHIMKQLSVPKGLEHKVARNLLAKVKVEIKARETKRKKSTLIARAMQ